MKSKLLVLSAALMLVLAGCSNANKGSEFVPASSGDTSSDNPATVAVQSVSLNHDTATLAVGGTLTLQETVLPANATNKNVTWSASGNGVVSVDDGLVTALAAGESTVTVTTVDGGFTASCVVTVSGSADPTVKPEGAVDLEYATADTLGTHGDDYCYFNDPEKWSGATATVNEAYYYEGTIVFDYTYDNDSDPGENKWSVQLMRKNTSLTVGKSYNLTFTLTSNKAGSVIINDGTKEIVVGANAISVTYTEGAGASLNIQFPFQTIGSARIILSNIVWTESSGESADGALAYATADTLNQHGDNYCYFNNPQWWEGGSATVNEATYIDGVLTYDYTYKPESSPSCPAWTVQLMRKNTSLTAGTQYTLSFNMNSSAAGTIIVNEQNQTVIVGDNAISVTYTEGAGASFNIQFPLQTFGSARVVITNITWTPVNGGGQGGQGGEGGQGGSGQSTLAAPVGIVVNPVAGGYIVAFAAVEGATGYKAYYVNSSGEDVGNHEVTNGGALTLVSSLPEGQYKVYVSSLRGEEESPRSTQYGEFQIGGNITPVAPVGVVVNAVDGGYIVAFAAAAGAEKYKAYYVNSSGEDVGNHEVTNGGALTLVNSLPAGTYKVYVTTIIGEQESPRSESFGTFTITE